MSKPKPTYDDEIALFKALKDKPSSATLAAIYYRYQGLIVRYLRFLGTDDAEEIKEVLSFVFTTVWEQRNTIAQKEKPVNWLLRIARNKAVDQFRKRKKPFLHAIDDKLEAIAPQTSAAAIEYKELEQLILQAADQLPPQEKKVFLLNKVEGLSQLEISRQEGVSLQTVRNQLHRALLKVRRYLQDRLSSVLF